VCGGVSGLGGGGNLRTLALAFCACEVLFDRVSVRIFARFCDAKTPILGLYRSDVVVLPRQLFI
jgi:hypothetical protein